MYNVYARDSVYLPHVVRHHTLPRVVRKTRTKREREWRQLCVLGPRKAVHHIHGATGECVLSMLWFTHFHVRRNERYSWGRGLTARLCLVVFEREGAIIVPPFLVEVSISLV
jgi:hypothetical protein